MLLLFPPVIGHYLKIIYFVLSLLLVYYYHFLYVWLLCIVASLKSKNTISFSREFGLVFVVLGVWNLNQFFMPLGFRYWKLRSWPGSMDSRMSNSRIESGDVVSPIHFWGRMWWTANHDVHKVYHGPGSCVYFPRLSILVILVFSVHSLVCFHQCYFLPWTRLCLLYHPNHLF